MMRLREVRNSLLHLFFPGVCVGCGTELFHDNSQLCLKCLARLPNTNFSFFLNNPVEKKFWGRLRCESAMAMFYFSRESLIQHIMHQFKYRGNKEIGRQLGRLMGEAIYESGRFPVDLIIPLPLFKSRERKRGFNQATIIAQGISEAIRIPIADDVILRIQATETQTKKDRVERWQNMEQKFHLAKPESITGKHILLVDDVVTTGATLESCGSELLKAPQANLSIATLCYASK